MRCAAIGKKGLKAIPGIVLALFCVNIPALADASTDRIAKDAEMYFIRGKADQALVLFNKLLATNPNSKLYLLRKVQCLHTIQEDEEALPVIDKLLATDPTNCPYNLIKSTILSSLGKYDEALVCARKACEIKTPFAEGDVALARALLNCHKYEEAQTFLTARLKVFPDNTMLRTARIKVGQVLGKWEQVISDCNISEKSLRPLSPARISLLTDRADAYKHLKKYDQAIKDYESLLQGFHDYRPAHVGLKDLYKLKGDKIRFAKEMKYLENLDEESAPPI